MINIFVIYRDGFRIIKGLGVYDCQWTIRLGIKFTLGYCENTILQGVQNREEFPS